MRRLVPTLSALALLSALGTAEAQGPTPPHATADPGVARNKNGKIKRSTTAKEQFEKQTGFPHGRPGYVIDHIVPLAKGGRDVPSNMQWQTKEEAKAKDRVERGQTPKPGHVATPRAKSTTSVRGGFGSSARSTHS